MRKYICAIGLALSLGCASAVVRPYVGEQQAWPIATGSIVNMKYGYPLFTSLPPSPYEVIGELRLQSPLYAQPEEGHMPVLIRKAEELEADAIVFVDGTIYFSTNYGPPPDKAGGGVGGAPAPSLTQVNRFNPDSFKPGVTLLAIRWIGDPPPGMTSRQQEKEKAEMAAKEAGDQQMTPPAEMIPPVAPTEAMPATEPPPATPPAEVAPAEAAPAPSPEAPKMEEPMAAEPAPVEPTPAPTEPAPAEPAPAPAPPANQ